MKVKGNCGVLFGGLNISGLGWKGTSTFVVLPFGINLNVAANVSLVFVAPSLSAFPRGNSSERLEKGGYRTLDVVRPR